MPVRRSFLSRNILLLVVGVLAIAGFIASYVLVFQPQEIRQQAAGCSESPVNVEFRKYTGKEEPGWKSDLKNVYPGDKLDVNCFSKNGTQLLTNGRLTATLNGKAYTVPPAAYRSPSQIRGWEIPRDREIYLCLSQRHRLPRQRRHRDSEASDPTDPDAYRHPLADPDSAGNGDADADWLRRASCRRSQ